jgi:hypothetical protein
MAALVKKASSTFVKEDEKYSAEVVEQLAG